MIGLLQNSLGTATQDLFGCLQLSSKLLVETNVNDLEWKSQNPLQTIKL
jgi:hypothetical protein